jgi:competence protein ComEA
MDNRELSRWILAGVSLALTLAIIGGGYALLSQEAPSTTVQILPPDPTPTALPSQTPAPLEIYVVGAVQNPEARLSLSPGSRVEDAIEAAGGPLDTANLAAVNLAQSLQDGDMIFVPSVAHETDTESTAQNTITPTPNVPRTVNINTATQAELESLPGIGTSRAQDIIAFREANGLFQTVDDLDLVPGIGPATIDGFRDRVTVGD